MAALLVLSKPCPSSAAPTPPQRVGCQISGNDIVGSGLGTPPPAFIRIRSADGNLTEILPLPRVQSDLILTESLIPQRGRAGEWLDVNCTAVNPIDAYGNVALAGPCDHRNFTIVDNGPKVTFAGAARKGSTAVIRVQVAEEKFFASGVVTLNDWVGFSVDGGPEIALPAKGVEPVYVTAFLPYLAPGRHDVSISVFDGFEDEGAPQGIVCL